jgi:hypothetical protein
MSDEVRDRFEIPKEMRSIAQTGLEQARKAFEKFLANAEAAAGSIEEHGATVRAGAKDINAKAIAYAEKNVQTSLDHAQSLLHAKRSLAEQAGEMGQIAARAAMDAAKPKIGL